MNALASNLSELRNHFDIPYENENQTDQPGSCFDSDRDLVQRIGENIYEQLVFHRRKFQSKQEMVRVFASDMERIEPIVEQWSQFVEKLVSIRYLERNLTVLPEKDRLQFTRESTEFLNQSQHLRIDDGGVLVDRLLTKSKSEIRGILAGQLNHIVHSLAQQMVEKLRRLREQQFLGTINWSSDSTCNFTDWRHLVVANVVNDETEVLSSEERQATPDDRVWTQFVRETKTRRRCTGKFKHIAQRQTQNLMAAESTLLAKFTGPIPRKFKPLIELIPDVLRSEIQVVTGESFGCEKSIHTFIEKNWLDSKVEINLTAVHDDPAIVIGSTVLIAWDETECKKEQAAITADGKIATSIHDLLIALCCLGISILMSSIFQPIGLFAGLAMLAPFSIVGSYFACRAAKNYVDFRRSNLTLGDKIKLTCGWLLLNLSSGLLIAALMNQFWLTAGITGFVFIVALVIVYERAKRIFQKV